MNRKPGRNSKNQPRSNRRLTPEEKLARNIAQDNRRTATRKKKTRSKLHAQPLGPSVSDTPGSAGNSGSTRRRQTERRPTRIGRGVARAIAPIRDSLTGEWLGGPEVIRHLPFFGFLVVLMLAYTFLEYQYEYDERAIKEGRKELRNLRHHEQSLRGRFESQLQRSNLDEDMADAGLTAPSAPPVTLPGPNPTAP